MADICVVYARADAAGLPKAIESAFIDTASVWWDEKLVSGDYRPTIEHELRTAGCVIPIWSSAARRSSTLHDEVRIALDARVPVLPVRIHAVDAPLGYGVLHATDILDWKGDVERPEVDVLKTRVSKALEERKAATQRPLDLGLGPPTRLPALFFSVSSHETQLQASAAVNALDVFGATSILVSAYDTVRPRRSKMMLSTLERRRRQGAVVLLDSGTYEKTRRDDKRWTITQFHAALQTTPHDLAFCFDRLHPPADIDRTVGEIVRAVARDAKHTTAPMLPIVHLPRLKSDEFRTDLAPELVRRVAEELRPRLIAIPERELGPGIFTRTKTMLAIRQALNELRFYQPVHVLGTGNPVSIALLASAGADSFDGLEWCRFVADADTATLHHFQHFELFQYQAKVAASRITEQAASDDKVPYVGKAILHNLDFYTAWIEDLRTAIADDKRLVEFMTRLLKDSMAQAREALPGIL